MNIKQNLQESFNISDFAYDCVLQAESEIQPQFIKADEISTCNQYRVLSAFQENRVSSQHFQPSTGYGYGDIGRDTLDRVFADAMGTEDALVRPQIASGTHALAIALFGLLRPHQTLLCACGKPYDTLEEIIGISGEQGNGSLKEWGVKYQQIELLNHGQVDIPTLVNLLSTHHDINVILLQRSGGYAWREALSLQKIKEISRAARQIRPDVTIVLDNCYGEFTECAEPSDDADVMVGSLIKNPGGGLAPTGAYIAGKKSCIEKIASRLTSPGIGREVGSYAGLYTPFYQGLFLAPHVVAQSIKGAILTARVFEKLGYEVMPATTALRSDIIQAIKFDDKQQLISFCESIQKAAPIDSHVKPIPWDMPGYQHQVIMAAGTFVQGASIELSADAPIKPPYIGYMQGGLTFEHIKIAIMMAVTALKKL